MKPFCCVSNYFILFIFLTLASCQSSDYSNPVRDGQSTASTPSIPIFNKVAEGFINGRTWQFLSGSARVIIRNSKTYLEIMLWNENFSSPCNEKWGSPSNVHIFTELNVGFTKIDSKDPLNLIPTIMFSEISENIDLRGNIIANNGFINISSLTDNKVEGSMAGSFLSDEVAKTEVFGQFSVPFCGQKKASN